MIYNGLEKDDGYPTYDGYSIQIAIDKNYVLKILAEG